MKQTAIVTVTVTGPIEADGWFLCWILDLDLDLDLGRDGMTEVDRRARLSLQCWQAGV